MARPRQVKKNRSSKSRVKTGTSGRTKAGKKKVNFLGNETIREHWDHKLTLAQNYEKLGLSVRLRGRAGGVEKTPSNTHADSLAISNSVKAGKLAPTEVQVVRDADGNIVEILDPQARRQRDNPLNDPLNDLEVESDMEIDDEEDETEKTRNPIAAQLEAQAAAQTEAAAKYKKPRKQSSREEEWIEKLIEKYGDDFGKMFRDKKLNPMQQSEGDLKKRVKKWKATHGE